MQDQITPNSSERVVSAIGYIPPLCLLQLVLYRERPFAQHHGKQALVLLLVWFLLWISMMIIPILGMIVWVIGSIILCILAILGFLNALQGNMWVMPVFGEYADKIKL